MSKQQIQLEQLQKDGNPNEVLVINDWNSKENAKKFGEFVILTRPGVFCQSDFSNCSLSYSGHYHTIGQIPKIVVTFGNQIGMSLNGEIVRPMI